MITGYHAVEIEEEDYRPFCPFCDPNPCRCLSDDEIPLENYNYGDEDETDNDS